MDDLVSFVVLAEELHFGRAGLRLHLTASGLSRRISNVEQQVGMILVDRTVRPLALTQHGRRVASAAQEVLAEIQGLQNDIQSAGS